jgi:hypothetical protein
MTTPGYLPTGAIPGYVPPHLRGKVWDFKNEDDGTISFAHPEASMGLSPSQSRVKLDTDQYAKTFDQAHRFGDLSNSMTGQYAPLEQAGQTSAKKMNEGIANALRGALGWGTSSQGKAVGTVGLLSALGAGAASSLWDLQKGDKVSTNKALIMALLAGTAVAGGTAWGQSKHNRRENFLKTASMDVAIGLVRLLEGDPSLSGHDKAQILSALSRAPDSDRNQLYQLLKTAAGAGAGVLAARFLGARGLLPMLAGGILGGMLGGRGSGPKRNAQGQLSITNYL